MLAEECGYHGKRHDRVGRVTGGKGPPVGDYEPHCVRWPRPLDHGLGQGNGHQLPQPGCKQGGYSKGRQTTSPGEDDDDDCHD